MRYTYLIRPVKRLGRLPPSNSARKLGTPPRIRLECRFVGAAVAATVVAEVKTVAAVTLAVLVVVVLAVITAVAVVLIALELNRLRSL